MTREEILAVSKMIYLVDPNTIEKVTKMIAEQAKNVSLDFSKNGFSEVYHRNKSASSKNVEWVKPNI